ncbi:MAG: hypothetical protein JWO27_2522 [Frankiales bacterium]|jgi:hypothetical protein|nr:hypothetical protein [Frankiales bacterium]
MADDDVQLTDLEVIQQFSLAVRGATAPRAQVIAALESDLAYLRAVRGAAPKPTAASAPARTATVAKPPAKNAPVTSTTKAPVSAATKAAVRATGKAPVRAATKAAGRATAKATAKKTGANKAPAKKAVRRA